MSASIADMRARLVALMGKPPSAAPSDDRREIDDMFEECQRQGVELARKDPTERRYMLPEQEPEEPLPTAKEEGKRYCSRCGTYKRVESFDEDAEHCRSHGSRPPRRASAA